jgi:hypothetical protein
MASDYLSSIINQFDYYKSVGEKTFAQIPDEKLSWQYNEETNSISTIVKHLSGNMLSRWTEFLTSDGEKDWRNRDAEFENDIKSRQELLQMWDAGWSCLLSTLQTLTDEQLQSEIYIRAEKHSVTEAINRQLAHYSYHVGQIVLIGKMICDKEWHSLTIPKGGSNEFNATLFAKGKK